MVLRGSKVKPDCSYQDVETARARATKILQRKKKNLEKSGRDVVAALKRIERRDSEENEYVTRVNGFCLFHGCMVMARMRLVLCLYGCHSNKPEGNSCDQLFSFHFVLFLLFMISDYDYVLSAHHCRLLRVCLVFPSHQNCIP